MTSPDSHLAHAAHFGEATARSLLRAYAESPSWFPRGLVSLREVASGEARAKLFTSCSTWTPSKEEEDLAAKSAEDAVQLAVDVAKQALVESSKRVIRVRAQETEVPGSGCLNYVARTGTLSHKEGSSPVAAIGWLIVRHAKKLGFEIKGDEVCEQILGVLSSDERVSSPRFRDRYADPEFWAQTRARVEAFERTAPEWLKNIEGATGLRKTRGARDGRAGLSPSSGSADYMAGYVAGRRERLQIQSLRRHWIADED